MSRRAQGILMLIWAGTLVLPLLWKRGEFSEHHQQALRWSVLGGGAALLGAALLEPLKWRVSPDLLRGLAALILLPAPVVVPLAAGMVHASWAVGGLTALMSLAPGLLIWNKVGEFLSRPNELEWIEEQLRRRARRYSSLSVAIVRQSEVVYAGAFGLADRQTGRAATPDTLYRIGSITKVLTTTLLAMLRDRGVVRLDDPVQQYLPAGVTLPQDPHGAAVLTLRHLATHASGLPCLPVNLQGTKEDPYGGYTVEALYAGLAETRLEYPTGMRESYSNLGMGLLGHVLERATGKSYEELLREYLFEPLGMTASAIRLTEEQRKKLARGYQEENLEVEAADWDLGCLAPAGGVASTVGDLAKFLSLQLRAGESEVTPVAGGTLLELHTPQRLYADWTGAVGLGWQIRRDEGRGDPVWHNGGMAGYSSYLGFSPRDQVGVIVLSNCGRSVDELGYWLLGEAIETFRIERVRRIDAELGRMADALAGYLVADPPGSFVELFDEGFLGAIPPEEIRQALVEMYEQYGRCEGVELLPGEHPRQATIVFRHGEGRSSRGEIEITARSPAKIIYLNLR